MQFLDHFQREHFLCFIRQRAVNDFNIAAMLQYSDLKVICILMMIWQGGIHDSYLKRELHIWRGVCLFAGEKARLLFSCLSSCVIHNKPWEKFSWTTGDSPSVVYIWTSQQKQWWWFSLHERVSSRHPHLTHGEKASKQTTHSPETIGELSKRSQEHGNIQFIIKKSGSSA